MTTLDQESMQEMLLNLVLADATLFIKFLYSQGYDMWLTQGTLQCKPTLKQINLLRNVQLLEKLKKLVEIDMCHESKLVESLEPHQLRITTLLQ